MSKPTRRSFIKTGAAASSFMVLPNWVVGSTPSPNSKVNIALIGVGGRGKEPRTALKDENFVAFCDVDEKQGRAAYEEYPDVPRFKDYRVMFDKMGKQIDAVVITTPDHMHYPIAMWAIANGKHVYCEKPLTRCVWEARDLRRAAGEAGVLTQMGNQGHSFEGIRIIKEWYDAGYFGEVTRVHHWTNRPIWPQGELTRGPEMPVPAHLDYNLWLGVAPEMPYYKKVLPFNWRGWVDFGAGAIGDMGCHIMDTSYTGLGLGYPQWIEAESTPFNDLAYPKQSTIRYHFAARDGKPAVDLSWQSGGRRPQNLPHLPEGFFREEPKKEGGSSKKKNLNGTLLIGTKATVFADTYAGSFKVFPDEKFAEIKALKPEKTIPRVKGGPHVEFADAIRAGKQPGSNFDYAAPFTEVALLGLAAIRAKQPLRYDSETMSFPNAPEANRFLRSGYEYRTEFLPG